MWSMLASKHPLALVLLVIGRARFQMHVCCGALVHLILVCPAHHSSKTERILAGVSTVASRHVPASSRLVHAVASKAIPDRYERTSYMPFDKTRPDPPRICRLGGLNLFSSSIGGALY
jgi:hypothetical protein